MASAFVEAAARWKRQTNHPAPRSVIMMLQEESQEPPEHLSGYLSESILEDFTTEGTAKFSLLSFHTPGVSSLRKP